MTVEVATYISELNAANPDGTSLASESDDQIRLLKEVLQNQFPNFGTAAVTATAAQLNSAASLGATITIPSPTPSREYARYVVPNGGSFVDNALSLQNLSVGGGLSGNAAIACYDAAGAERAAFGYSRNETVSPAGFIQRVLYLEGGNINADAQDTDVLVVITHGASATNFPGTSLEAIRVHADTGHIRFRTQGSGVVTSHSDTHVGQIGTPKLLAIHGATTSFRAREYIIGDHFAWTTNVSNMPAGSPITQDSALMPSWSVSMGGGLDQWTIKRAGAGGTVLSTLLNLTGSGVLTLNGQRVMGESRRTTTVVLTIDDLRQTVSVSGPLTLPAGVFAAGDFVRLANPSGTPRALTAGVGLTLGSGGGTAGSFTLKAWGLATLWYDSASVAIVSGDVV